MELVRGESQGDGGRDEPAIGGSVLRNALRAAGIGAWAMDLVRDRMTWSHALHEIFGVDPAQLAGTRTEYRAFVHSQDAESVAAAGPVGRRPAGGETLDVEYRVVRPSGEVRLIRERGAIRFDAAGSAVFAAGVVVDVTEARRTESELARASRALEMLSRCNEALMRLTEERALLDEICRIGVEVGGYRMASVLYARDDADKTITPIAYAGHEAGYFSNIRISWSTAIAEGRGPVGCAVRAGRAVVVPDMAADPDFALWAPAALARGYRSVVALPLKSGERVFGAFCLYSGEVRSFPPKEVELLHELASDLAFGIAGLRVKDERQLLIETATTISDLSAASTGTAYFERVLKALLHRLGAQAGFVAGNPSADGGELEALCAVIDGEVVPHFHFSLLGTPCEDVVGDAELVIEREVCSAYPRAAALARLGAQAYVGRLLVDANGERIGTIFILYREPLRSRVLAVSMLRLFGTRVAAEIVRQRDESRLRDQALLLDKAQDAILVRSLDHKVGYWNQGAERLYGWSAREVENRSVIDFKVADAPRFLAAEEAVLREGEWMGELEELRKDGGRIWVECRWTLLRDDNGAPRSVLAINTDITERKMAQIMLAEKEARVAHAQKLESVGQLTGGIAHDFNNLLTVIIGNSEQLIDELAGRPPLAEMARMIRAAGGRGAELTSRLLAFARRQALEPRSVDPAAAVEAMLALVRRTLGEHIRIDAGCDPQTWRAFVDPNQFELAILNLCINARDAMDAGGRLLIETANVVLDEEYAEGDFEFRPGEYVMIAVTDTGSGIPREHLSRVFEPFFTTKPLGKGTGLGLSMVYGFIKQSGGTVKIYSEQGAGTTVKLFLPRAKPDRPVEPSQNTVTVRERGGDEILLLVEDDELLRNHSARLLRDLGYRVLVAANGREALGILRGERPIDLLFTDVMMSGGINGPQLAEMALALRPGLPVLYTSGYTENAIVHDARLDPGIALLHKPYDRDTLARRIREVLQAARRVE